ncbi:MAG: CHASE domain-containing protein [Opitutaceae bacterium]|jgi:PAS domain S-box-containing protein
MKPRANFWKTLLKGRLAFIIVVVLGLGTAFTLYRVSYYAEHARVTEEFFRRASVRHALISESVRGYEECLYNLRNLFANSDDVTLFEFQSATRDIRERHQGIQALQWVPVVPGSRRGEIEAWARHEIIPTYKFTELTDDGQLTDAGERPVHYPILYTDPIIGNEPALGFDLAVGPSREDLIRGAKNHALVMTRKVRLVQEQPGDNQFGVIMACPVFRTINDTEQLFGFVQIVFRLDDMLGQSWANYPANTLDTLILDLTTQTDKTDSFLFSRRATGATATRPLQDKSDLSSDALHSANLVIGGRTWRCYYAPKTGWIDGQISATPRLVFTGSMLFALLLGAYFISIRHRTELIEQQVSERTAELRHTQGLLEADIHKRQSTEAELRESRRQIDNLLRQMPGMAYRYPHHSPRQPSFISRGSIEIVGYTPQELIAGTPCYENLIEPEDRAQHQATVDTALASQHSYESEYRLRHHEGGIKWVLDRGQGIYSNEGELLFIEGLAIDITRRKEAEAEKDTLDRKLLESQKLESLGVLAGGIAHDFNNLLTSILGHASISRIELPRHSPLQQHLSQIESGAQRAAELCQQMLAYAGKGRFLVQHCTLETLVRDTTPLLEHSISKRASLYFRFHAGVPDVDVDATQIRQIIMNLVVNASDAIGEHDGIITIETVAMRRNDPQLARAVLPPPTGEGDFACLRVQDTGAGMSAATLGKIFDPFFTTKFAGRGLGLAAVLGIVRSHQGSLLVSSAPGSGSTFTLLLPAASLPAPVRESRQPFESRAHPLTGTVLLIDDEEGVRAVADQMFRTFGLKTLTAADGVEGLELFEKHRTEIALILLDLTMPRMNGEETLHALRVLAPQIPVIVMSGYNESSVPELATDDRVSFLQKPFSLQALRRQISKMLA